MDTLIGKFNLTETQVANIGKLSTPFKGWGYNHDTLDFTVASEVEPTQAEKDVLVAFINSLSNEPNKQVLEQRFNCGKAKADLFTVFGDNVPLLREHSGLVVPLIDYKNFAGLKAISNSLSGQDVIKFKQVFLNQGIDLGTY